MISSSSTFLPVASLAPSSALFKQPTNFQGLLPYWVKPVLSHTEHHRKRSTCSYSSPFSLGEVCLGNWVKLDWGTWSLDLQLFPGWSLSTWAGTYWHALVYPSQHLCFKATKAPGGTKSLLPPCCPPCSTTKGTHVLLECPSPLSHLPARWGILQARRLGTPLQGPDTKVSSRQATAAQGLRKADPCDVPHWWFHRALGVFVQTST